MNQRDIYHMYGFAGNAAERAIFEKYRPYVINTLNSMFEDSSIIQVDEIIEDAISKLPELDIESDIELLIYDCLRKKLTELLRAGLVQPKSNRILLNKYKDYILNGHIEAYSDEELECIFSCFQRKTFDYFVEKYYYFNDSIKYNRKQEKVIKKLFEGKGDVRPLYLLNQWRTHTILPETYMYVLNGIPFSFLNQISGTGIIIPSNPDVYNYFVLKFQERQKVLPIMILLFVLFMIVLLFQVVIK